MRIGQKLWIFYYCPILGRVPFFLNQSLFQNGVAEGRSAATPLNSLNPNKAQLPLVPKWPAVKFGRMKKPSQAQPRGLAEQTFLCIVLPTLTAGQFRDTIYLILKVLLFFIWIQQFEGRGSTFTFCHGHLKKAILLHKMATVRFVLLLAVSIKIQLF